MPVSEQGVTMEHFDAVEASIPYMWPLIPGDQGQELESYYDFLRAKTNLKQELKK